MLVIAIKIVLYFTDAEIEERVISLGLSLKKTKS